MNAAALIKKVDAVLTKYGAPSGKVYKRVTTVSGGDPLIGRPSSVSFVDTEMKPQPAYERGGRQSITGERIQQRQIRASGRALTADQAIFLVSASAITAAELQNPNLQFVIKSGSSVEVFQVDDYDASTFNGAVVSFEVYARSIRNG